jgi:hypothetical protein
MVAAKKALVFVVALLLIVLQGCASSPDKPLSRKGLESVNQIKIVRSPFPGYMKDTKGSKVAATAVAAPFMLFGAIGGGIGGGLYGSVKTRMMTTAGKEMQTKYDLPDFTELVHKQFSDRLTKDLSGGPELAVENIPTAESLQESPSCLLTIGTTVVVGNGPGLQALTAAQLTGPAHNVLWKKSVSYKSADHGRPCKFNELEAENGKLLHEEVTFAVQKTVEELVNHFENMAETTETQIVQPEKAE